jgi:hypothetical protein
MNGDLSLGMSIDWSNLDMDLDCQVEHWETQSPSPKMIPYWYRDPGGYFLFLTDLHNRGSKRSATPMPGVAWELKSPIKELIPIESVAGHSWVKGKGKEQAEMDEGLVPQLDYLRIQGSSGKPPITCKVKESAQK